MSLDFTAAIDAAHTLTRVDELALALWRANADGTIS